MERQLCCEAINFIKIKNSFSYYTKLTEKDILTFSSNDILEELKYIYSLFTIWLEIINKSMKSFNDFSKDDIDFMKCFMKKYKKII